MRKWTQADLIAMQADRERDECRAEGYRSPRAKYLAEEAEYYYSMQGQADRASRRGGTNER